jgi:DNA-binding transcriptional LysR family regulator
LDVDSIDRVTRRLKLQNLRVLDAVVRSGSMARAAGELHISQPAISKAIGELEHTLGVRVLDRGRYGVEPTAYGRALLRRSVTVFDELRESIKEIEYLTDPTAGELRIGALEAVAAGLLAATIERLSRTHPRIIFHVTSALSHNTLYTHDLRERKLDLAIGRLTSFAEDEFKTEVLFNEQLYVVAGTTSPWARRRRVRLAELVNEPWIFPPETSHLVSSLTAEAFHASGLEVPRATVLTLSLHIRNGLLASGRYLTLLPGNMLRFGANYLPLKVLPIELPIKPRPVGIVTLRNRTLNPVAQLFLDCAREVARPLAEAK